MRVNIATFVHAVVRGEKTRKEYAVLLLRHRAACVIQKRMKGRIARKKFKSTHAASMVLQSGKSIQIYELSHQIFLCMMLR